MAFRLSKNRIKVNEFTDVPDVATYSGVNRGLLSPRRTPHTFFGENQIRDNSMRDTVVGTPGTIAANLSLTAVAGLTTSVKANVVIGGITYTVINFAGTSSSTQIVINLEDANQIAALNGQVWGYSAYIGLAGSDTSHITGAHLRLGQRNSGAGLISNIDGTTFAVNATPSRRLMLATLTGGATVAFISPQLRITLQNTQPVNMDVYIGMHCIEQNIIRNQPQATFGYPQPSIWVPDTPDKVDPRQFGAVVDAVQASNGSWTGTDNTTAIYKAAKIASRSKSILTFPQGAMIFSEQLIDINNVDPNGFRIEGQRDSRLVMKTGAIADNFQAMIFDCDYPDDGIGVAPLYYFTAAAPAGSMSATFNSVANLYERQWLQLRDWTVNVMSYATDAGEIVCKQGQVVQIDTIVGLVVTFKQCLEFDYAGSAVTPETSATNVQRYLTMPNDLVIENLTFDYDWINPSKVTQYRMMFRHIGRHRLYGINIHGPGGGFADAGSLFGDYDRCSFFDGTEQSYNYTVSAGSSFGKVTATTSKNCRHCFQSSTSAIDIEGAHWVVADGNATAMHLAAFSGHPGIRNTLYIGCHVSAPNFFTTFDGKTAGFQLRGRMMRMVGCSTAGTYRGVEISGAENNSIDSCYFADVDVGVRINHAKNARVTNTLIHNARSAAIQLENRLTESPFTPYSGLKIDIQVTGTVPALADIIYLMRTDNGETTPQLRSEYQLDVDAVDRDATFKTTNSSSVLNGVALPGEYVLKQDTKTASFTCLSGKQATYIVTPGASAIAVTVPAAATFKGKKSQIRFVKTGSGVGVVTLTPVSGNIDGSATKVLATFLLIESDGANWFTVG